MWLRSIVGDEVMAGFDDVHTVYLNNANVTDGRLEHLKGLTKLEWLWLDGTRVTDSGLKHLQGLTKLQVLSLNGTQVTEAGVKDLQAVLPRCEIIWSADVGAVQPSLFDTFVPQSTTSP
jgi:hypothetical protein